MAADDRAVLDLLPLWAVADLVVNLPEVGDSAVNLPRGGGFGGPPPMGGFGGPPPMGGMGGMGGFGGYGGPVDQTFIEDPLEPIYVVAVVETKNLIDNRMLLAKQQVRLDHKWGSSMLIQGESPMIVLRALPLVENGRPFNLAREFNRKMNEAKTNGVVPIEKMLEMAEWALTHGMNKEFNTTIDEAAKVNKDHDIVKKVLEVRTALDQNVAESHDLKQWQDKLKLGSFKAASHGHYTVLHNGTKETPDVTSKLERLEDTFRRYYFWFALRGKILPMPQQKLLAIYPNREEEFLKEHQAFDAVPLVSDGFVARRENLVVFAPARLDQQYSDLMVFLKPVLAQVPDTAPYFKGKGEPAMQTLLLLRKALEDDADISTASREGAGNCWPRAGFCRATSMCRSGLSLARLASSSLPRGPRGPTSPALATA